MNVKAKCEMLKRETFAMFPYLIEITLNNGTIYRYSNSDDDITFENNVYTGACFSISPPDMSESTIGNGTLTISAIDQEWIKVIRQESKRARIRFVASIVYDDNNGIETVEAIEDTSYILTEANWNDTQISWLMVYDEDISIVIPCDTATALKTPALV